MQIDKLKYLACPDSKCLGALELAETLPCIPWKRSPKEILEGFVTCRDCREVYPILKGILFLIPNVWKYLSSNFMMIKGVFEKYGGISPPVLKTVMSRLSLPLPKQILYDEMRERAFEKESQFYLLSHYGGLWEGVSRKEPLFEFLQSQKKISPHDILISFVREKSQKKCDVACEIGCNVGGFLAGLSRFSKIVFGIDLHFETLLLARKILKSVPEKYRGLKADGSPFENVELVLASGESLPFERDTVDIIGSANVLDVVDKPFSLLQEKFRVLRKRGKLVMATPYIFKNPLRGVKNSREWLLERLRGATRLEKEIDPVCWIYKKGLRHYEIFYTHCLSAVKN